MGKKIKPSPKNNKKNQKPEPKPKIKKEKPTQVKLKLKSHLKQIPIKNALDIYNKNLVSNLEQQCTQSPDQGSIKNSDPNENLKPQTIDLTFLLNTITKCIPNPKSPQTVPSKTTFLTNSQLLSNPKDNNYYTSYSKYMSKSFNKKYINMILRFIIKSARVNNYVTDLQKDQNIKLIPELINIIKTFMMNELEIIIFIIFTERIGFKFDNLDPIIHLQFIGFLSKEYTSYDISKISQIREHLEKENYDFYQAYSIWKEKLFCGINGIKSLISIGEINKKIDEYNREDYNIYCQKNYIDYNCVVDYILFTAQPYGDMKPGMMVDDEIIKNRRQKVISTFCMFYGDKAKINIDDVLGENKENEKTICKNNVNNNNNNIIVDKNKEEMRNKHKISCSSTNNKSFEVINNASTLGCFNFISDEEFEKRHKEHFINKINNKDLEELSNVYNNVNLNVNNSNSINNSLNNVNSISNSLNNRSSFNNFDDSHLPSTEIINSTVADYFNSMPLQRSFILPKEIDNNNNNNNNNNIFNSSLKSSIRSNDKNIINENNMYYIDNYNNFNNYNIKGINRHDSNNNIFYSPGNFKNSNLSSSNFISNNNQIDEQNFLNRNLNIKNKNDFEVSMGLFQNSSNMSQSYSDNFFKKSGIYNAQQLFNSNYSNLSNSINSNSISNNSINSKNNMNIRK